jgi:hypothetical protein
VLLGEWKQRCQAWAARRHQQQAAVQHWAVLVLRSSLVRWRRRCR